MPIIIIVNIINSVAGPHQSTRSTKVRLSHLNPWPSSSSLAYSGSASERHLRYATCEMRSVIVICVSNRHQRPCVYPSINHGVTVTSIAIVRECTRRCFKNTVPCHLSLRLHGIPLHDARALDSRPTTVVVISNTECCDQLWGPAGHVARPLGADLRQGMRDRCLGRVLQYAAACSSVVRIRDVCGSRSRAEAFCGTA